MLQSYGERISAIWAVTIISVAFIVMNPLMPGRPSLRWNTGSGVALTVASRDPLQEPFSSGSIWNMPIGSSASFVATDFTALQDTYAASHFFLAPQIDEDLISLDKNAPLTNIETNNVGWGGGDRCTDAGATLVTLPIPTNWTVPNNSENGSAALLKADGRTIYQNQPFTRCVAGSFATALSTTSFPDVDLYGSGESGSHGGSKLSALGGTIRLGELRPGQQGPRHALKMNVDSEVFFFNCSTGSDCFRWPATVADSGATSNYGSVGSHTNASQVMGMLLAIPGSVDLNALGLESDPGKQLAWTLQNYGAYVVDSSGSGAGMALEAESGPSGAKADQFESDFGTEMQKHVSKNSIDAGTLPPTFGYDSTWSKDIRRIWVQLKIVDNNTVTTIGGGGTPRQPIKPPISP